MSYLVFCTFDLKNASSQDYQNAHSDLEKIGLKRVITGSSGKAVIPTTSAIGEFNGSSASGVCADIRSKVQAAFNARKFKSEIFLVVGGDWAWCSGTT